MEPGYGQHNGPAAGSTSSPIGRSANPVVVAHDAQRVLLIDGTPIRFAPAEYRVLRLLLDHADTAVAVEDVAHAAFGRSADQGDRLALYKHIDRLRSKLRPFEIVVLNVTHYGYILFLHSPVTRSVATPHTTSG